jgi:hypothetical protein
MTKSTVCACLIFLLTASVVAAPQHDRSYWRAIAQNQYAPPPDAQADFLAGELSALLASPDPELRDDLAYSILARWIYRGTLSLSTMQVLTDEWRSNLKTGIGESGTNSVLHRSFSALCLSEMAKREAKSPFMGAERYHHLVAEAITYLQAEHDLRGYDATLHWIHATAHTADLLAALADSPLLTKEEAAGILNAITARLITAPQVYTQGEQDRLAVAVVSVIRRNDFDASTFAPWLAAIDNSDRDVWATTTPELLARYQNHTYMLQALMVRIALEKDSPRMTQYGKEVLSVLSRR